ncbi:MAG TPA: ATP-binding cassette domain-containing protein [Mycobacteriales bacterium]|jgi:energy-coupling factor transport system ATP-binding protein|nr:ATP-binding cassette domain-containing protein [Mycobacteriales bacterium]
MARIRFDGWGWRHPGRKAWAVRGLDLTVEPGERVLLLGPSGAGKSTVLRALTGLLDPDLGDEEGVLTVDGEHPRRRRTPTGYVQQDPESQLVMARAGDDVAFGLENHAVPADRIAGRVASALRAVGFPYGPERPTAALSGGEQQRLALAGVLALEPRLLLLDEPTANLDPAGATAIRATVGTVQRHTGATLLLVEHRVAESLPLVDRVVVLAAGGGVLADGTPEEVLAAHHDHLAAAGVWVPGHRVAPRRSAGPAGPPLLAAAGVGVSLGDIPVLTDASLTIGSAEIVALTGSNGAGKTTLSRVLGGLLRPGTGTVTLGGDPRPPWRWRARELAARVGTVFQDPEHQFLTPTVRDELLLGPRRAGVGEAAAGARADELLARLRLCQLARANPFTLSGGEQRRLSVATALASSPRLLVLDEPTFGQDLRTWTELVDLLDAVRADGTAMLVVTHDLAFTDALADRVVTMAAGRCAEPVAVTR